MSEVQSIFLAVDFMLCKTLMSQSVVLLFVVTSAIKHNVDYLKFFRRFLSVKLEMRMRAFRTDIPVEFRVLASD